MIEYADLSSEDVSDLLPLCNCPNRTFEYKTHGDATTMLLTVSCTCCKSSRILNTLLIPINKFWALTKLLVGDKAVKAKLGFDGQRGASS